MSLFQKLCETYDSHQNLVGVYEEGMEPLAPVAHRTITPSVTLEITINKDGKFVSCNELKKECFIIPITIDSDNRTSTNAKEVPHSLCDKLSYFDRSKNDYKNYVRQLQGWCNFDSTSGKLKAILAYVQNGSIMEDLDRCHIKYKDDTCVRWRVVGLDENDASECWKDLKLFDSWQKYYDTLVGESKYIETGLCMVTGECGIIQLKHAGVMGKSKVISDKYNCDKGKEEDKGFKYTGRFIKAIEACSIGYRSSQKFHNALRWQMSRGVGLVIGSGKNQKIRKFACWNPKGSKIPSVYKPFPPKNTIAKLSKNDYGNELKKFILGFRNDLPKTEDVVVLGLDAVSKGRVSITYYSVVKASDFLDRIEYWYGTFCWNHRKYGIRSPSLYEILRAAFGREEKQDKPSQNENKGKLVVNEKIVGDVFQELLNCVLLKQKLPYYLVRKLFTNVCRPQSYSWSKYRDTVYEDVLFAACAVIRKYLNEKNEREEWSMELDDTKMERSYLFGRLLAVLEKVELDTYDRNETREPNAIRMQSAFCEKPLYCFNELNNRLVSYFSKLKFSKRKFYKNLIGEITAELAKCEERELNKPLKESFVLGYYLQRNELYKWKEEKEMEENENVNDGE